MSEINTSPNEIHHTDVDSEKSEEVSRALARAVPPVLEWRSPQTTEQTDLPDDLTWSA